MKTDCCYQQNEFDLWTVGILSFALTSDTATPWDRFSRRFAGAAWPKERVFFSVSQETRHKLVHLVIPGSKLNFTPRKPKVPSSGPGSRSL